MPTTNKEAEELSQMQATDGIFSLQAFLGFLKRRWYLYVISIVVCLGVAWLILQRTPHQYSRATTVLIKDPTFGNGVSSVDLSAIGVMPKYANLDNEMAIFTSPDLMEDVVKNYNLNNLYYFNDGFKDVDIYKQEPAIVTCTGGNKGENYGFTYNVGKDGSVTLKDFVVNGIEQEYIVKGHVGAPINTPAGKFVLDKPEWVSPYIGKDIIYRHTDVRGLAEDLAGSIKAENVAMTGTLIHMSMRNTSAQRAEDVLNGVIQAYNDQWVNDKQSIAEATSNFINDRLGVIEKELGSVDSNISGYKSRNLIPNVEASSQMQLERSNTLQQQYFELSNQISVLEFIRGELGKESIEETLPTNMGLDNAGIESQIGQYNQAVIERNRLLSSMGSNNPIVIEKGEALRTMKRNIQHSAATYGTSLHTRLAGVRNQENAANSQLASAPRQANYLLSVERQQKVKEALYLFLLQKREENELAQAFTSYNTQVVRLPNGPASPVMPNHATTYIIAFIIGLIIPTAGFMIRLRIDTKIHVREDVENLGIPFIGEIPQKSGRRGKRYVDGRSREIVVRADSTNIINEAFRVVRTNLDFFLDSNKNGANIIMLTSANPGSGKTFVSLNLGVALALKGNRVLIMDFDLRRASLSESIGTPSSGIAKYLIGNAQIDQIINTEVDGIKGLDVIGVGSLPPNPSELLYSKNLPTLIADLKAEYDFILFDCPPIELVADSRILNQYVDTTIFVVRSGLFDRRMLKAIQNLYKEKRYNNMCLLLNGTDLGGSYGYGYGYGYSYAYGKNKK